MPVSQVMKRLQTRRDRDSEEKIGILEKVGVESGDGKYAREVVWRRA